MLDVDEVLKEQLEQDRLKLYVYAFFLLALKMWKEGYVGFSH